MIIDTEDDSLDQGDSEVAVTTNTLTPVGPRMARAYLHTAFMDRLDESLELIGDLSMKLGAENRPVVTSQPGPDGTDGAFNKVEIAVVMPVVDGYQVVGLEITETTGERGKHQLWVELGDVGGLYDADDRQREPNCAGCKGKLTLVECLPKGIKRTVLFAVREPDGTIRLRDAICLAKLIGPKANHVIGLAKQFRVAQIVLEAFENRLSNGANCHAGWFLQPDSYLMPEVLRVCAAWVLARGYVSKQDEGVADGLFASYDQVLAILDGLDNPLEVTPEAVALATKVAGLIDNFELQVTKFEKAVYRSLRSFKAAGAGQVPASLIGMLLTLTSDADFFIARNAKAVEALAQVPVQGSLL